MTVSRHHDESLYALIASTLQTIYDAFLPSQDLLVTTAGAISHISSRQANTPWGNEVLAPGA